MSIVERDVPLAACPDLSCSRRRRCQHSAYKGHCLITHYAQKDEWMNQVTARIHAMTVPGYIDPDTVGMTEDERVSHIYQLLKKRAEGFASVKNKGKS